MDVAGIYVVEGPAGVYVGSAVGCFGRNDKISKLGLPWGIVREMPDATLAELRRTEMMVADAWAARGFAVVSRNTTMHRVKINEALGNKTLSPEQKDKIRSTRLGKPRKPETIARMSASLKGRKISTEHRAKISAAQLGRKRTPEACENIRAGWRRRVERMKQQRGG